MVEIQLNLESLPASIRGGVESYARVVSDVNKDNLQSLTLFGRAVSKEYDPSRDVIRNVVVMERVDLNALRALSLHGLTLGKAGIAAPLIMTPMYIASSLDTIPIELLTIQQRHVVIFGTDPFESLAFDQSNVRLQCERDLKAILIGLRQGLLAAAGRDRMLGKLECDAAESLLRILRAMLWLTGTHEALDSIQVIEQVETKIDRQLSGIRSALDPNAPHGWRQFEALYADVECLGKAADGPA